MILRIINSVFNNLAFMRGQHLKWISGFSSYKNKELMLRKESN